MDVAFHEVIGVVGAIVVVTAYFLNQIGKLSSDRLMFPVLNLVGASGIVWSLFFSFNAGAFLIEASWVVISLIGIARYLINRKRP